ncbi:P-loop containing nucleoside triphosphate hydrolase protein [Serendipita vermifera]|nr:P-loop containing nucleoside triphosphate hydrolase protein [Serendipita vermifera]
MQRPPIRSLTVIGDEGVGKTALVRSLRYRDFSPHKPRWLPPVMDQFMKEIQVGQKDPKAVRLSVWDTSSRDEDARARPCVFSGSDAMIICFSVEKRESLENAEQKWLPEAYHFCPGVPVILVASKTDLRTHEGYIQELKAKGESLLSREEGETVAQRMGAKLYVECSTANQADVDQLFQNVALISLGLSPRKEGTKGCRVL